MKSRHQRREIVRGLQRGDGLELGFDRLGAMGVDRGFVDAGSVKFADFLGDRVALACAGGRLLQDAAQEIQVVFVELAVDAPGGLVGRDGILLLPAAAGVLVEIHAGVDGFIDGFEIETGGIGELSACGTLWTRGRCDKKRDGGRAEDADGFHRFLRLG
jgi:hypothetical protein